MALNEPLGVKSCGLLLLILIDKDFAPSGAACEKRGRLGLRLRLRVGAASYQWFMVETRVPFFGGPTLFMNPTPHDELGPAPTGRSNASPGHAPRDLTSSTKKALKGEWHLLKHLLSQTSHGAAFVAFGMISKFGPFNIEAWILVLLSFDASGFASTGTVRNQISSQCF